METATLNLCFEVFNYQKSKSGICLHLSVLGVCLGVWERVTEWSSFLFFFRWVFARVLLIPQKPRRSKGADGKNSQSEPAWMPWKIPLSVRVCLFDPPSVRLSEWGSACSAYTCKFHLHLSFINAWLPLARDPDTCNLIIVRDLVDSTDQVPRGGCVSLLPRQLSCCTSGSLSQRWPGSGYTEDMCTSLHISLKYQQGTWAITSNKVHRIVRYNTPP